MRTIQLPVLLLLLATQQQPPPPQPTFKSGITLVEVDVVVTDKAQRPVRGLRKADFELFEDGRPVEVVTFSEVHVPDAPPAAIPPDNRSGSAFASNEQPDSGRLILIVLDDVQLGFSAGRMATVRSVARRAVERLGPGDVAGVLTTSGRMGAQAEFTSDKRRLIEAINRFVPQTEHELPAIAHGLPSSPGGNPRAERIGERRTQSSMMGLAVAARALGSIPHRRKGVLLISQGFPATLEEIIRDSRIGAAYEAIRLFMQTAQRSNVAVYAVDPCGLEVDAGCTRDTRQSLRTIAEVTGGFAAVYTNAPEAAVDRMMTETGAHYLIGYTSPAAPNDGKHHRISVRTRVADVDVRAREGYDAPRKAAQTAPAADLEALTRSVLQAPGQAMRAIAIPAPLPVAPLATVIVGIDLPAADAVRAGRIAFAIVAIDEEGKTRAQVRFTTNFAAAPRTTSPWTRTGSRIDLPPGRYQIRIAADGGSGARGSVFTEVLVPRFDTELGVGGLSLGAASPLAVTDADRLRGVLPLVPVATNEVAPGTAVEVQVPIRVWSKAASNPLTITTTLVRGDGTVLPLDRLQATGREYATPAGKIHRVPLPPALTSGRYRIIVEATLGRTAIVRELELSVL